MWFWGECIVLSWRWLVCGVVVLVWVLSWSRVLVLMYEVVSSKVRFRLGSCFIVCVRFV